MTVKAATFEILDNLTVDRISGWQLFDMVRVKTGRNTYPQTLLDYAREWADISGGSFRCVDTVHSVYRIEHGAKISGAIFD